MDNAIWTENINDLSQRIAIEKNFNKHVVAQREFQDPAYGPVLDIKNKEDLQAHVKETLISEKTECFRSDEEHQKNTLFFYNKDSNTYIVVPGDSSKEPSVFRPDDHEGKFQQKLKDVSDRQIKELGYAPEIKHGIYELVPGLTREQPQITKDFTATSQELTTPKAQISEAVPSMPEIAGSAGRVAGKVEHVVMEVGEAVLDAATSVALGIEEMLFGGASRKAPGGAEYTPPSAGSSSTPVEKPAWLEKKEKLRTTSGFEATQDQEVKGRVEEKQGQSFGELFAEIRRNNEKAARERADLYRDRDDDSDRDRDW